MTEDEQLQQWETDGGQSVPVRDDGPVMLTFPLGRYGSVTVKGVGPVITEVRS